MASHGSKVLLESWPLPDREGVSGSLRRVSGAALCHLVGFEAGRLPGPPGPKVGSVSLRFFCALQAAAKAAPKARPVSTCFIRALQAAAKKEAVPHDGGVKARSDVDLDPWLHALHANV